MRKPFVQGVALSPSIHQRDTAADFSNRDKADERAILVQTVESIQNTFSWAAFRNFRQNIRVEEEPHRDKSRGSSFCRSMSSSAPRRGDPHKNSASDPRRAVFLCHSSAETTTTLGFPLR